MKKRMMGWFEMRGGCMADMDCQINLALVHRPTLGCEA